MKDFTFKRNQLKRFKIFSKDMETYKKLVILAGFMLLFLSSSGNVFAACSITAGNISASIERACKGDDVTLTFAGVTSGTLSGQKWWKSADGENWEEYGSSANQITVENIQETTYFLMQVWCETPTYAESNVLRITVLDPVAYAGEDKSVCAGGSVNIGIGSPVDEITYSWQLLSGPSPSEVTINSDDELITGVDFTAVAATGTYTFQLTASCGPNADVKTVNVELIDGTPIADVGVDDDIICGSVISIGTNNSNGLNFEWTADPVSQEDFILSPHSKTTGVIPNTTTTYTLRAYGCSPAVYDEASVTINVNPLGSGDVDAGDNKNIACNQVIILDGSFDNENPTIPGFSMNEDFNDCNSPDCHGWTVSGGSNQGQFGIGINGNLGCDLSSVSGFVDGTVADAYLTSNNTVFLSLGTPVTLKYKYAAINSSFNAGSGVGDVTFNVEWSGDDGATWNLIGSTNNENNTNCNPVSHTFTPPMGQSIRIRFNIHNNANGNHFMIDDIVIEEEELFTSYEWTGGSIYSGENTLTPIVNPDDDTEYTLTVTQPNGCSASSSVWVYVEEVDNPVVNLGSDITVSCGEIVTIGEENTEGSTYFWTADPVSEQETISSPNSKTTTISPKVTTTYTLRAYNCDGDAYDEKSIVVTVENLDDIISAGPDKTVTCGDLVTLDGSNSNSVTSVPGNFVVANLGSCDGVNCGTWSITGGLEPHIGSGYACGGTSIPSAHNVLDNGLSESYITSGILFTSNGMPITINYTFAAGNENLELLSSESVTFTAQWSNNGYTWYDIETFNYPVDEDEVNCTPSTHTFTPVVGNDVRIRFHVQRNNEIITFFIGDIVISQDAFETTYSWSGGPIFDGGNTLTPSVNPINSALGLEHDYTGYTLTVTDSYGCTGTSSVQVDVDYFVVDAGADVTISCGDEIQLEGDSPDHVDYIPGTSMYENFFNCTAEDGSSCNDWEVSGGHQPGFGDQIVYQIISGGTTISTDVTVSCPDEIAAYDRIGAGESTSHVTSTTPLFTSNGGEVTINFNYRTIGLQPASILGIPYVQQVNVDANEVTYEVEWSNDGSTWQNIATFGNDYTMGCVSKSFTFTPPVDEGVYIRFSANSPGSDERYYSINNIEVIQVPAEDEGTSTYSWTGGPIIEGDDTLEPTISPSEDQSPYTYTLTVNKSNGCIANDDVTVTVNAAENVEISHTECDSYTWSDGDGGTYNESDEYTWSTTNENGCEYEVILDLTINESTSATDEITAYSNSYTWIDGNTYTEDNSTATYTTTNENDCPHVITLDLTFALCAPPILIVDATTKNSASFSWDANPDAVGYQIRYKKQGAAVNWIIINVPATETSYTLTGLHYETDFYVQIRTLCVNSDDYGSWMPVDTSGNTEQGKFSTLPLEDCDYPPIDFWQENPQLTSFEVHWDDVDDIEVYNLRYKVAGAAVQWNYVDIDQLTTSYLITNLSVNTDYYVQIRTMCATDNDYSVLWKPAVIMSTLDFDDCNTPPELQIGEVAYKKVELTWTAVPNVAEYDIRYKKVGVGGWMHKFVDGAESSVWLTGLATGVPYYVQISNRCEGSNIFGNRSSAITIVTTAEPSGSGLAKFEDEITTDEVKVNDEISVSGDMEVVMYPNPTSGVLNIDVVLNDMIEYGDIQIHVYDMSGRIVSNTSSHLDSGFNNVRLNLGELTTGLYSVVLYKDEVAIHRGKVQKH